MLSYLKSKLTGFNHPMGGGSSGGGGGGTSVTTQEIPAELKPLASAYTSKAINLSNQAYTPYTGQRYADLNNVQQAGLQSTINRAASGDPTLQNAESGLNQFMSGQTNPYLDANVQRAMDATKGQVMSQFGGSNYETSANQEQLASQLGNVASQMYGNAYNQDQANRLQAIGMAPQISQAQYQPAQQLMNAGQVLQDQNQQNLDWQYQQFSEAQDDPYKKLAAMGGVFGTNLGGTSTTTQQQSGGGGGK